MGIVYLLSWNGLGYVGSTIQKLKYRIRNHHIDYKNGIICRSNNIIKNEGYEVIVIEEVENETKEECREREQFWIEFFSIFKKLENSNYAYGVNIENNKKRNQNYHKKNYQKNKEEIKKKYALKKLSLHNIKWKAK